MNQFRHFCSQKHSFYCYKDATLTPNREFRIDCWPTYLYQELNPAPSCHKRHMQSSIDTPSRECCRWIICPREGKNGLFSQYYFHCHAPYMTTAPLGTLFAFVFHHFSPPRAAPRQLILWWSSPRCGMVGIPDMFHLVLSAWWTYTKLNLARRQVHSFQNNCHEGVLYSPILDHAAGACKHLSILARSSTIPSVRRFTD